MQNLLVRAFVFLSFVFEILCQHNAETGLQSSQEAKPLANNVPRFIGPKGIPADLLDNGTGSTSIQDVAVQYGTNLGILAASGIIIAVIVFITGVLFCICRTCCGCCGGRHQKSAGYTMKEKLHPFVSLCIFIALVFSFSVVGFDGNQQFSSGIVGMDGITTTLENFFDQLSLFFQETLTGPVELVQSFTEQTADEVNTQLNGTMRIETRRDKIVAGLDGLETSLFNLTIGGMPCDICTNNLLPSVNRTRVELVNQTDPVFEEFERLRNNSDALVQELTGTLGDSINSVAAEFQIYVDQISDIQNQSEPYFIQVRSYESKRKAGFVILFVLPLLFVVFLIIGSITKTPLFFRLMFVLSFLVMVCFWILFGIHLPTGTLMADGCLFLDAQEQDFVGKFGKPGEIFFTCLTGDKIAPLFGLGNITVPDAVDFSSLTDLPTNFSFTEIRLLEEAINNISARSQVDAFFVELNAATVAEPVMFDRSNIATVTDLLLPIVDNCASLPRPTPPLIPIQTPPTMSCADYTALFVQARDGTANEAAAEAEFNATFLPIRAQVAEISADFEALQTEVDQTMADFILVQENLKTSLLDEIEYLVNKLNCRIFGELYRDLKQQGCSEVMGGMNRMVTALFFIPIFSIPIAILSIVLWKRIDAVGDGKKKRKSYSGYAGRDSDSYTHSLPAISPPGSPRIRLDGLIPSAPNSPTISELHNPAWAQNEAGLYVAVRPGSPGIRPYGRIASGSPSPYATPVATSPAPMDFSQARQHNRNVSQFSNISTGSAHPSAPPPDYGNDSLSKNSISVFKKGTPRPSMMTHSRNVSESRSISVLSKQPDDPESEV